MRISLRAASAALLLSLPVASTAGTLEQGDATKSWTIPVPAGQLLEVQLRTGGAVSITGWDRDEVSVESDWTEERCRDARLSVTRTGQGVRIESSYPPGSSVVTQNCSFGFVVKVPRRFDVQIRSAGGSVAVAGVRGEIRGRTGGGMIELADLRGSVQLRTGGGQIHVWDSDLEGRISTGGGQVRFENVSGGVTARSGSKRGVVRGRSRTI